jgi:hypothetical protein
MPLALIFSVIVALFYFAMMHSTGVSKRTEVIKSGGVDPATKKMAREGHFRKWSVPALPGEERYQPYNREAIETALLRTCRVLNTLGHLHHCPGWDKESTVWKFVGAVGTKGSLSSAWSGSANSVFSCSDMDKYGRYYLQKTIPASEINKENWKYDFRGVGYAPGHTDPCGYSNIVSK